MAVLILLAMLFALSVFIVNTWYKIIMKITGSTGMMYSTKKKFGQYFFVFCCLLGLISLL